MRAEHVQATLRRPSSTIDSFSVAAQIAYARHLYRIRRQRDAVFGNLSGEPAWDMLLDLFISHQQQRPTSISSLCIAACVPSTTALRWITALIAKGVLARQDDPADRRRSHIMLTSVSYRQMAHLLRAMMAQDPFVRRSE
ncbi:MarR family transcriptional regulator [uncultured Sphingomonas sp.]|uniref:MarR family transcriptional regulator n=1 Tax=uncultured Sphingomonas sp. TaxID=158754 RepID=UPI0035CAA181